MSDYIPYGRQNIIQADIDAVIDALTSDWITQGPTISRFEEMIADYCGVKHAVAITSATAALHIACLAVNLGPGDWLWTSPNTFVASANCGLYCGAQVDFIDIDPQTYNISVEALECKLIEAQKAGKLPKVLVPVHLAGQSCEMERIATLADTYNFIIIEDASHAIGATYQGKPIGNCCFSDMAVFSFHPVKIITTGEGGMVTTNDDEIYVRLNRLRTHGITRQVDLMTESSHGPWYYQQLDLGLNYRMTELQAALGTSQMQRLDEFVARRRYLATRYDELLADLPVTLPWQHPDTLSSWHLYIIRLHLEEIDTSHRQVFEELRELGIGVNLHYIPVHTQPYYQNLGFRWGDCPEAERYYREAISIPLYYDLTIDDQDNVVLALQNILAH